MLRVELLDELALEVLLFDETQVVFVESADVPLGQVVTHVPLLTI